ncbi:MAG: AAA family ATPase [Haliscomenobacter sp.]|nr:AAA family ATPase [Haliscomenobacter sp.]
MTNDSSVFFIDEIDRSLHPSMTKALIAYFMSRETKGQLVFTTHESNVLDLEIFRQDEIWFTEKTKPGRPKCTPLSDYKPRYDLDIQKGYLAGRFGAIPFLGNLKDLNWQHAEKQGYKRGTLPGRPPVRCGL